MANIKFISYLIEVLVNALKVVLVICQPISLDVIEMVGTYVLVAILQFGDKQVLSFCLL